MGAGLSTRGDMDRTFKDAIYALRQIHSIQRLRVGGPFLRRE